jgi:WhiB family redox-sensing transcriptional regulator
MTPELVGLCAEVDPEIFFPDKGESPKNAKLICRRCDVQAACLEWALATDVRFGIWGGMSTAERQQLKKEAAA